MNSYDLIIGIYACDTIDKYRDQIHKINETYGDYTKKNYPNIRILYFLGEEKVLEGPDYIHLPGVGNDYFSASLKQFEGLKYIHDNFNTKYIMFIGTDTYPNIKKLINFCFNFNPDANLYIGGHGDIRNIDKPIYFHSGGPGFILTKGCLTKLYPLIDSGFKEYIDICNKLELTYLIPACDVAIAHILKKPEINSDVICNENFKHCNYKQTADGCGCNKVKISDLISCHNNTLNDFDEYTKILNENNHF